MECANSVRVRQSQWCDGLDHCGDNSDETDCAAGKTAATSTDGGDDGGDVIMMIVSVADVSFSSLIIGFGGFFQELYRKGVIGCGKKKKK